jgi:HEAT repeat protein
VDAARRALLDSSYKIVAAAIRTLSVLDPEGSLPEIIRHLDVPSHRGIVAAAALSALVAVDTARGVDSALTRAKPGNPPGIRQRALGILARTAPRRPGVEQLLITAANERRRSLRWVALRSLGDVGREDALHALERIAADSRRPDGMEAEKQASRIRDRLSLESTPPAVPRSAQ